MVKKCFLVPQIGFINVVKKSKRKMFILTKHGMHQTLRGQYLLKLLFSRGLKTLSKCFWGGLRFGVTDLYGENDLF